MRAGAPGKPLAADTRTNGRRATPCWLCSKMKHTLGSRTVNLKSSLQLRKEVTCLTPLGPGRIPDPSSRLRSQTRGRFALQWEAPASFQANEFALITPAGHRRQSAPGAIPKGGRGMCRSAPLRAWAQPFLNSPRSFIFRSRERVAGLWESAAI